MDRATSALVGDRAPTVASPEPPVVEGFLCSFVGGALIVAGGMVGAPSQFFLKEGTKLTLFQSPHVFFF